MKEFRYRTDLLNREMICFRFDLSADELDQLLRTEQLPPAPYFKKVHAGFSRPKKVQYWEGSVVEQAVRTYLVEAAQRQQEPTQKRTAAELREFIVDILNEAERALTVTEIVEAILNRGLAAKSEVYPGRIGTVLRAMVRNKQVQRRGPRPQRYWV